MRHRVTAVLALAVLFGLSSATTAAATVATTAAAAGDTGEPDRDRPKRSKVEQPADDVVKAGWWWAGNQPPAETGMVAYPQQSPPNVPAGSLPVAAAAGEPEKISAIELRLDVETGGTAESARLVLRESESPGANTNAETAKILACAVTEAFWADGTAARWDSKPAHDCELAQAEGVRREDGRWVFDLTPLTDVWLGESPTSPSFVLVESVDNPESFQVVFDGPAAKGVRFKATYLPPTTDTESDGDTGDLEEGLTEQPAGGSAGGTSSGGDLSSGSGSSGGASSSGPASLTDPAAAAKGAGAGSGAAADEGSLDTAAEPTTQTAPLAAAATAQPWHAGLVKPALVLVPLVFGLAYLAMVALGPDAQPSVTTTRHGVGRALERLRLSTTKTIGKVTR